MEGRLFPTREEEHKQNMELAKEKDLLFKKVLSFNQTYNEYTQKKLDQIRISYEKQEINQMRADISALKEAANAAQIERAELRAEIKELKKLLQK